MIVAARIFDRILISRSAATGETTACQFRELIGRCPTCKRINRVRTAADVIDCRCRCGAVFTLATEAT